MNKRSKAIIIALIAVPALGVTAAVAVPMVYRNFFVEPAAEAPMLSADDSALESGDGAPLDPETLSGDWVVGEGSYAGYRVDEVLNGSPVTVTGRTDEVSGTLTLDGLTLEQAAFEVDVASIATDSAQRDSYFRDQAIDASAHPTASFELTAPVTIPGEPAAGEVIEQTLTGDLSIAGVVRSVTFTVQLKSDGATAEIAGQIPVAFADFGVEAPNLGFVAVEPAGIIEFSIVAARA